jgi:protein-disulfide isomerase
MPNSLTLPVGPRDHALGSESAPLVLVEYGDFECPQCALAHPIVKQIENTFGSRLRFVFRHFPLTNSHPHAQHAAEAAEWAATFGVFWQMHDALYANGTALADRQILDYAAELGLPTAELERAWAEHSFIPRVKEDFMSGIRSGVTGTPSFFINGVRHEGTWDELSLSHALQAAAAAPAEPDQRSG